MRAILLLFDSLKKAWLPPWGGDIQAPNFTRLAAHAVAFDNCYIGSMPCMPARRELHTGRYNFLHRGWGPLEPFDDSMPELLAEAGVHTHLVSDHHHYWRDGGANYHGRYTTWENVRGQEGDCWKARLGAEPASTYMTEDLPFFFREMVRQDGVNRSCMQTEAAHCQTRTFDLGLEFIEANKAADNWFLQLECFDPHEPFFACERYRELYPDDYAGRHVDWPAPAPADQDEGLIRHVRNQYKALVSQIDHNLGRLLDVMDKENLWEDTLFILGADHGLLLAEHGWWSKGMMPAYNEIANIPLLVWDPRSKKRGEHRGALVQNIDVCATLLDFFGRPLPPDMQGRPLRGAVERDEAVRDAALYGYFGGNTCITDGRYTYFRGPENPQNAPLYEYTLMPAGMGSRKDVKSLREAVLAGPFAFTKGCPVLKLDAAEQGRSFGNMFRFGSRLYDLAADPGQAAPIDDTETELRLVERMMALMRENDAPPEQFKRLGLREGMTAEDLAAQHAAFRQSLRPQGMEDLDFSVPAGLMFGALAGLMGRQAAEAGLRAYLRKRNIQGQVLPGHLYAFAGLAVPRDKLGLAMMLLKLNEHTD